MDSDVLPLCSTAGKRVSRHRKSHGETCSIDGCVSPSYTARMCSRHYDRFRKGQDLTFEGDRLDPTKWRADFVGKRCSVDTCARRAIARGLCQTHYERQRKGRDMNAIFPMQNAGLSCSIDGCNARAQSRGLCATHLNRWQQQGIACDDPRMTAPVRHKTPTISGRYRMVNGYISRYVPADTPGASVKHVGKTFTTYVMLEHRYVMQNWLGRPLLAYETVHHRDGNRANNSIENLELKSGSHGPGITIIDGLHAAVDWIVRYASLDLAQRAMMETIKELGANGMLGEHLPKAPRRSAKMSSRLNGVLSDDGHYIQS